MRLISRLAMLAVFAPAAAAAQTTPWGDPDLQGLWTNQTPVPLERPAPFADKPFFTPEEAALLEKNALPQLLNRLAKALPTSGELNEIWLEAQSGRVGHNRRTSLVADPADGRIPFTAEGKARWDATPSLEREIVGLRLNDANEPADRPEAERCITSGGIFVPNPFYNNYHQIVQAPGYVVILTEMMHEHRVIPLDGRPQLGAGIRQWLGDSRGRWEGKTLVVETANFNDRRRFYGSTARLKLTERFTGLDDDAIAYELIVEDPETFSRPWTIENTLRRRDDGIFEVACHEGNYGLANILSAARAAERR